ncbi:unnamed protein product [Didymodactylos carnosus]|uniref:Uncharacterized protein n=1 Tax=Didymodactylos carnosus TaxID=1234261 RepID=A0A815JA82_9BILA|nr:unnamed protein product [Didymodactylos carnosus]CAF1376660.1 unnamed protein product [Didymodactylos carnosus]CAF3963138.1 unnamed protein product [Didymodactylos carnosus]CAF4267287.1 unnamed protein product [Didymodactylos carnosus]
MEKTSHNLRRYRVREACDEANGQMIVGLEESWLLNKENENEDLNARRTVSEKALSYLPLSHSSNENKDESGYGEKNQSEMEENLGMLDV